MIDYRGEKKHNMDSVLLEKKRILLAIDFQMRLDRKAHDLERLAIEMDVEKREKR